MVQGAEHPAEDAGTIAFRLIDGRAVLAGNVQIGDLAAGGLGHTGGCRHLFHRSHVKHLLMLRRQGDIFRFQRRQLRTQGHGIGGQRCQLHIAQ